MNVVERILSSDLYWLHAVQSALVANHSIFLKWSPIRSVQITGSSPILHAAGNCKNSQCTLSLSPKSDGLGFGTMRIYHYSGEYSYETAPTYFFFFLIPESATLKLGAMFRYFIVTFLVLRQHCLTDCHCNLVFSFSLHMTSPPHPLPET